MKKIFIGILAISVILLSCNSASTEETDTLESAATNNEETPLTEEDSKEEESGALAFNGVDKGEYTLFGHEDISADDAVSQSAMFESFKNNGEFMGKVNVSINEVCQKAGCWINFKKDDDDETVMVFFRDHFNIPIEESAGKEAILYGNLITDTLSVDFQRHLLDDAAEAGEEVAQADYDAITEEKVDVSFDCVSILIK